MAYIKITYKGKNKATLQSDIFDIIREHFSVENDSFFGGFKKRFGNKKPRSYIITPLGLFDIGMTSSIVSFASAMGVPINIDIDEKTKSLLRPILHFKNKIALDFEKFELRPYQKESIEIAIPHGRGVIVLPTATGKTLTMASLVKTILAENPMEGKYVLVLVPDIGLVNQTHADFVKYGLEYDCTKWSGSNEFNSSSKIIVCNQAILRSDSQESITKHLLENTGLLLIDEVHTIRSGNVISKIVANFKTPHRFGFTGTLPDAQLDQWNILGKVGPILTKIEAHEMRQEEWIAPVKAKIIHIVHKNPPHIIVDIEEPTKAYNEELEWLISNKFRNKLIASLALKLQNNSLLLVNRLDHGHAILEMAKALNTTDKEIHFIEGRVEVEDRAIVTKMMEEKDNIICIAMSSIFSTGISINNLHHVFFCAGGKSRVRIIQSIGRGSRLHHNKEKMILFDISDNTRYSLKHLNQRIALYKEEKITYEKTEIKES